MNRSIFHFVSMIGCLVNFAVPVLAGSIGPELMKVRSYRQENEIRILQDFFSFLSVPNIASDLPAIRKNAELIQEMMRHRGVSSELLVAHPDAPPVVFGEWRSPSAKRTLLLYAHYDGQPVDPEQWSVTHPWKPVLIQPGDSQKYEKEHLAAMKEIPSESRIYARSASDDKAGVFAVLTAFEALKNSKIALTSNLKFFFEGEEEAGSPNLDALLKMYAGKFQCDAWIVIDGPVHQSGRKDVVFGVRGDTNVDITVYGANRPLHSGHYGNWAPNPAMRLARLLASMMDEKGLSPLRAGTRMLFPYPRWKKRRLQRLRNTMKN